MPLGEWPIATDTYLEADGSVRERHVLPLAVMPEFFRGFAEQLSAELHTAADTAVGVLRWRSRTLGPRRPYASRGIHWSLDGIKWRPMPSSTYVEVQDTAHLEISEAAARELQELLDANESEPLAHELFREAWDQRTSNPRSSLLIGMTALEVGIKQYIAHCVPDATWLADNAPTPDVVRMLREYLPTLQPPGEEPPLPACEAEVLEVLKTAVSIRNTLAHRGADVSRERLLPALRAIRNVLWKLDEARGHAWAAQHLFPSLEENLPVGYRLL